MDQDILIRLMQTLEQRKQASADSSYVARLLHKGEDAILKKIGEEATEVVLASKSGDPAQVIYETADLLFHNMVLLASHGLTIQQVLDELGRREGLSGIVEKQNRSKEV